MEGFLLLFAGLVLFFGFTAVALVAFGIATVYGGYDAGEHHKPAPRP